MITLLFRYLVHLLLSDLSARDWIKRSRQLYFKSTVEITQIISGDADPSYFTGTGFLESTFENMRCWRGSGETFTEFENYAHFFLLHCCSMQGEYDMTLDVEADTALSELAQVKKL